MKFIATNKNRITVCALAVFVFMQFPWQFAGISFRTWLVYLYTLAVGLLWVCYGKKSLREEAGGPEKKKWVLRKWSLLDSLLAAFLSANVLFLIRGGLTGTGIKENPLLMIILVVLFFLLSGDKAACRDAAQEPVIYRYVDIFLGCGSAVCLGLFFHFCLDFAFTAPFALLLKNEQALFSFLLTVVTLAAEGYYRESDKGKRYFYALLALTGCFLIFLQENMIGILLGGIGFLVSALVHKPQRQQIKRISQLAFSYFFLLSNMPLLQRLIPAVKENEGYGMEDGVYLLLLLVAVSVVFVSWWERQPEEEQYLLQYKRGIFKISAGVCFVLLSLLLSGSRLEGIKGKGAAALYDISVRMQEYGAAQDNTVVAVLEKYGLPGLGWLLAVLLVVSKRVWERSKRGKLSPALTAFFVMHLLQSFFLAGQEAMAPVYVVFMVEILYGECVCSVRAGKRRTEKPKEERDLKKKMRIRGILFCLAAFIVCFFVTGMEVLTAEISEGGEAQGGIGESVQDQPAAGVPIENATLMYAVEKVNIRSGPGTDTDIVGELAQEEMVFAVELLAEGWYRIVFDGKTGYVRQDFLALYGIPGAWEAPEHPTEPIIAGQDSVTVGKRTVKGEGREDDAEEERSPAANKAAKGKRGSVSTVVVIAAAVLLILGYGVFQVMKEKQENEKEADGEGQEPETEARDSEEETGMWKERDDLPPEDSAWEAEEEPQAAELAEEAGGAEVLTEDELVILDIDEV